MKNERKTFLLLLGPVIAVACVGLAIVSEPGSEPFTVGVLGAIGFMVLAPLIQIILLATEKFSGRDGLACAIGLGVTSALLLLPYLMGVFAPA